MPLGAVMHAADARRRRIDAQRGRQEMRIPAALLVGVSVMHHDRDLLDVGRGHADALQQQQRQQFDARLEVLSTWISERRCWMRSELTVKPSHQRAARLAHRDGDGAPSCPAAA